uniref:Transmembrane protein 135 N-terminal domain-containing protein n=1 Tax=Phlebotomus papatasi TaxID=29031 RepID=A0A1B0DIP9_PHLPP
MCGSAGLLHLLDKQRKTGVFWFIIPPKKNKLVNTEAPNEEDIRKIVNLCPHREKCLNYIFQGVRTYANYGLMLEILRNIMSNFGKIKANPGDFLSYATKRINYNLVTFLMAYVGCYRMTSCLLNNFTNGHTSDFVNIAAGFIGGLAYSIWPNYNLFTSCIVTMLQVYWQYLLSQENCPKIVKEINRLPLGGLIYGFCMAVAVQVMVFYPDKTAHLSYTAINAN